MYPPNWWFIYMERSYLNIYSSGFFDEKFCWDAAIGSSLC